ncbi:unnamed protein product [Bursaphelenchus xylophilus]|uniref:(pine wood nematode) hypothetical protein n=1 Tax=Bursaphelenchus xylophilus TaxID=6326 RepID=A0A1I7S1C2_BURXY|nr:unnamed protein product [Bursaphelenchus xylophilus]CAG9080262.1 unnamed protein product [Bursaphelenchus xylophilus]
MTTTTDEKVAEETYKKLCDEFPDCPGLYSARLQMLFMKPERNVLEIRKAAMRMLKIVDVDEVFKFLGNGSQHDMNKVKNEEKMKEKVALLSTTYGILVETLMDDYLSKSSKTSPAEFKNNFQFEPDLGFNEAPVQNEGIWGQKDGQLEHSKSSTNQIENGAKSASERRKGNFPNFGTIANVIVKLEEAKRRAKIFDGKAEGTPAKKSPATEMQEKSITLPAEDFTVLPAPPKQNVDEDLAEIDRLMVEYSKFPPNPQDLGILSIKQSVCHENYGLALDDLTGILRKQKCQRAFKAAIQIADILGWTHLADQWRDSYIARYCIPKRNF